MPADCILRDSPLRDNLGLRVVLDNGGTRADRSQQRLLTLLKVGHACHAGRDWAAVWPW